MSPDLPVLASVCGLYCGACTVYLATQEDSTHLIHLAGRLGQTVEETRCQGCRSGRLSKHCRACDLSACANEKGVDFCGACSDYPCKKFEAFRLERPHRRDILRDMDRILEAGAGTWVKEAALRYACPNCAATNSGYDLACRKCGHEPGSSYAGDHGEAIRLYLSGSST